MEPSFLLAVVDRMEAVTDAQSIGAMRALAEVLRRPVGGSTGTNLWACATLIREMAAAGDTGSVVTLLCDGGDRYASTYYNDGWLAEREIDWKGAATPIRELLSKGDVDRHREAAAGTKPSCLGAANVCFLMKAADQPARSGKSACDIFGHQLPG